MPAVPDLRQLTKSHRTRALAGISIFRWSQRSAAKRGALEAAQVEYRARCEQARLDQQQHQHALDQAWQDLNANEPGTVMAALAEAFEDNEAAAAPLGIEGSCASVVVHVPTPDVLPDRMPGITAAGNLSLRQMTKRQASDFYHDLVCGYILVTVKEALAVAPGLTEVAAVAVRRTAPDAYGAQRPETIMAARFTRTSLTRVRWSEADSPQVVHDASSELLVEQKGAARELQDLNPALDPDLATAIGAIDLIGGPGPQALDW